MDPTNDPSMDPTKDPTVDPTQDPTKDPTNDPTVNPTDDPSNDPTTDPTANPTSDPTDAPSTSPSVSPTSTPSSSPLSFAEVLEDEFNAVHDDKSSLQSDSVVVVGIGSFAAFILIVALITNRNDDQDYTAVALYLLQCLDVYSDIALALLLYQYYGYANNEPQLIERTDKEFLALLCWVCALSAIIPYFLNIFTAITIIGKIARERYIPSFTKDYFDAHTGVYALCTLLNGGCYTTLALLNSKLFNLSIFNSGLSAYKLRQFEHFKIVNTVILENTPQITIQALALYTFGGEVSKVFGATIWVSFVTSLLSILFSLMVWGLRRKGNNDYFRILLDIAVMDGNEGTKHMINDEAMDSETQQDAKDSYDASEYLSQLIQNSKYRRKLGQSIANYIRIASSNIEILSAFTRDKTLRVNGIFRCNKLESRDPKLIQETVQSAHFIQLLQNVYSVSGAWLNVHVQIFDVNAGERESTARNTTAGDEPQDARGLLNEWNLGQYWNAMQQHGFDEVGEWEYLCLNTEQLKACGFEAGHIVRFQRKCKQHWTNDVELQVVEEGGEGHTNKMTKVQSHSDADVQLARPQTNETTAGDDCCQQEEENDDGEEDDLVEELVALAEDYLDEEET
eukprot:223099_1